MAECEYCGETFDTYRGMKTHIGYKHQQKYDDKEWLEREYKYKNRSMKSIGDECGVALGTIQQALDRHGIETRGVDGQRNFLPSFYTKKSGVEKINDGRYGKLLHHRLCAVAWFGWDAVVDKQIHHENRIPWDNRESNLTPLTPEEHGRVHGKQSEYPDTPVNAAFTIEEAETVRRDYENNDTSYKKLAEKYDVCPGTIGKVIRKEAYVDES